MKDSSVKMLKNLFGKSGEEFAKTIETTQPEFARLVDEFALERIWSRKGLPLREKSLITISSQAALGRWDQVELHMKSFLHMGGKIEELTEVLIHLALYCGFPAAIAGFKVLEGIKSQIGSKGDPSK